MDSVRVSGEVPLRGWKEIAGRLEASEKDSPPTGKPLVAFRFSPHQRGSRDTVLAWKCELMEWMSRKADPVPA